MSASDRAGCGLPERTFARVLAAAVAAVILAVALPFAARAAEPGDVASGRSAVEGQISAFRRDDAAAAFAFASPTIRSLFGDPERFLEMVKRGYAPVYRPRGFKFGPVRDTADGFEQDVDVQDEHGVDWDAVYSLERQPDGSWKISGCRLVKRPGESA